MASKTDRNILEAFMEGAEAAVDFATENEAVKAVPVVGSAFKLLKGLDDLRSRALRKKLQRFLDEPSLLSASRAKATGDDILRSAESAEQIGETLFLILDKVTDMTKPVLLAKCFATYLDGKMQPVQFEALAHSIDLAFTHDLQAFRDPGGGAPLGDWQSRLTAVGFMRVSEESWKGAQTHVPTTLGNAYRFALAHADQLAAGLA